MRNRMNNLRRNFDLLINSSFMVQLRNKLNGSNYLYGKIYHKYGIWGI